MHPKRTAQSDLSNGMDVRQVRILGALLLLLAILAGSLYLHNVWRRYYQNEIREAVNLGDTVGVLMPAEQIAQLQGNAADNATDAYRLLASMLSRMTVTNRSISHAFLVGHRGEAPLFLADTGALSPWDEAYPGTLHTDELPLIQRAFASTETLYADDVQNSLGQWVTTLTPIYAGSGGAPIAVLGITYPQAKWRGEIWSHMMPDLLMVLSLLLLTAALFFIFLAQAKLRAKSAVIARDRALFHSVFEQAPIGISIGGDDRVTYTSEDGRYSVNRMFEEILGRSKAELEKTSWRDITHPDDLAMDLEQLERYKRNEVDRYTLEKRFLRPDGTVIWTNLTIGTLIGEPVQGHMHLCLLEDITARKQIAQALLESERSKAVLLSHLPGLATAASTIPNGLWNLCPKVVKPSPATPRKACCTIGICPTTMWSRRSTASCCGRSGN